MVDESGWGALIFSFGQYSNVPSYDLMLHHRGSGEHREHRDDEE